MNTRFGSKKLVSFLLTLLIVANLVTPAFAATAPLQGGSYFTDTDNWGGYGSSTVDGDLDVSSPTRIGNGAAKYPIEFKITGVDKQPAKSAYLLIRAYDVDEYDSTDNLTGEWDRVYFSANPSELQLGDSYTQWTWPSDFKAGDYRKEFPKSAYVGALSGNNNKWNTTVLAIAPTKITASQDYYVALSTHHYYAASKDDFQDWVVEVDWGQLVLDGGSRETGEISKAAIQIKDDGKMYVDTGFLPKTTGNFGMEVSLIKEEDGVEQNLDTKTDRFLNAAEGVEKTSQTLLLGSNLDPTKEYKVNIILFDDRGGAVSTSKPIDAGKAQHILTVSTFDPQAKSFEKQGLQYEPIAFNAADFQNNYFKVNGTANGTNLQKVQIVTLPDAAKGKLVFDDGTTIADVIPGQEIAVGDLSKLKFVPAADERGFFGTASFKWNGFDGTKYAFIDADVTINGPANALPTVDPIVKQANKGEEISLPAATFTGSYFDPENAPLNEIKIASLPDADMGKLVLGVTEVTYGQKIPVANLGQLKFVPNSGKTGPVSFDWNGSDGTQYARADKKVTIMINTPPVIQDVTKAGLAGAVVSFTAADFANAPAYTDADSDPLQQVKITLPSDFGSKGTLWYTSVSTATYINPGTTKTLTPAQLSTLKFQPAQDLPNGSTVTFPWVGNDGKQDAEASALVKIAYNGVPAASPLAVSMDEGTKSLIIELKGVDAETVTGMVYGINSQPSKGTLVPATENNPDGNKWIYTPNPNFTGEDSFTYTVTDADGQKSQPATVKIKVNKLLDGWAGNKNQGDATNVKTLPGYPLPLSALSQTDAAEVIANVNGVTVPLILANPTTFATDGFKKWELSTYKLPEGTNPGVYKVTFTAKAADQSLLPAEPDSRLADNNFEVPAPSVLQLTANPAKIVGDGKSTTTLTALLTDTEGKPIANTEVVFSAPDGVGSFVGSNRVMTDSEGRAVVTYKSAKIKGIDEQQIPIKATVLDVAKGVTAQSQIMMTFMPPTISGVITKGGTHEPVAGATVRATLDLNGDGKIEQGVDFDATVVTKADGSYSIPVPEGDKEYNLEITQNVTIGGVETPVTYKQQAKVGVVSGSGSDTFDSEKTVTGVVLFKKQDGASSLFNTNMVKKMKVYLKDAEGNYISENGRPKGFELEGQGVFNASGLSKDVTYTMEIRYELEPGKEIIVKSSTVKVNADGEMNISQELVDPYGKITDAVTHAAIEGATVTLYYANTQRNIDNGKPTNSPVVLPAIEGFAPNDNKSPDQLSDATGFYAFMVYPETDYYLVIKKAGYDTKISDTISVEKEIVKRDFELTRDKKTRSSGGGGGGASVPTGPDVTLNLTVDKNLVKEGDVSTITLDYKNQSGSTLSEGEVSVTIPEGAELVNANGGTVNGKTVTWKVTNLGAGQGGSFKIEVKWPQLTAADTEFEFPAQFTLNGNASTPVKVDSAVKVKVFSDRFGDLKHQRYILGYPDKEFKPNNSLTRAELAAIVARLTENGKVNDTLSYKDVREDHWAANYIKIATKHGYFSGFEDGSFRPEEPVTRGELASVMARFLKLNISATGTTHFTDVEDHWAGDAIESLYRNKFLAGYEDGTFKPQDKIRRVEAVTMINRMLYRGPLKGASALFPDVPESHWGFGDVQEATFSHEAVRNQDGSETWKRNIEDDVK
ncbi:S-layer homology domain-containing protein [Paenibacillus hamazuiensis]|uniref:S-layer homology domain-containing protein n=1 Tax=Paenibacillus hamazuiensis TaxID=2936508 RepID=UPI00200D54B6|nr:S-layer homology domain-containing protein [Paenibacillus hamazuiensis]